MQSFLSTVVITVVVWSRFHVPFSVADESTWSLRLSNSGRDGRFLNVPIYYGDWVPITRAKQTIQAVASKIEAATKQYRDPPPEIITADQPEDRYVFFDCVRVRKKAECHYPEYLCLSLSRIFVSLRVSLSKRDRICLLWLHYDT